MSSCDHSAWVGVHLSVIRPPLKGRHFEVGVYLVSMGLHSIHLVGMWLGLGISGVKKSTCEVAFNKEQFNPTGFSPKKVCPLTFFLFTREHLQILPNQHQTWPQCT